MVFDKKNAMRNAERYLAQGKIQSAISEYKQVVANDPKDFGTLNMLGDLYTKTLDKQQAVSCYTPVAEHYSKQGFAQKAIAVYNKISKLQPNSIEIYEKLADLYKLKGSANEARVHYTKVAEHYQNQGRKLDALEVRKQIGSLDPNDTRIYLDLANAYIAEKQQEEAAAAFGEAAARLAKQSRHPEALDALQKALELAPTDTNLLSAFAKSHIAQKTAGLAAEHLATANANNPRDHEILQLLIDCYLESDNATEAEKAFVTLVELDPTSYPKLLDLARLYLKLGDCDGAARAMAVSCEHVLLAGQVEEFGSLVDQILETNSEQIGGLRLRVRLAAFQRDDASMQESLEKLATVAKVCDSSDDERFALSQLVMIVPHVTEYADRLREINQKYGYEDESSETLFDKQFKIAPKRVEPELEAFTAEAAEPEIGDIEQVDEIEQIDEIEENDEIEEEIDSSLTSDFAFVTSTTDSAIAIEDGTEPEGDRLTREIESIQFYIDNGYGELASKAINELRAEFGNRPEIDVLEVHLQMLDASESGEAEVATGSVEAAEGTPVFDAEPALEPETELVSDPEPAPALHFEAEVEPEPEPQPQAAAASNGQPISMGFGIDDLRSELGLDEPEAADDSDYDTHYHVAVAYQEMGLLDDAVKEFQEAVALVQPNDPTRRFFQCANLLGHCFMLKGMPNLALTWYQRALETPELSDEEKQGIWYELAAAYEADGDLENAGRYFEQVYTENINFRDVSERVKNVSVTR